MYQRIGLIGKFGDPGVATTLQTVAAFLAARQKTAFLDRTTAEAYPQLPLETIERDAFHGRCDLAVVVGGDGTLLNVARSLADAAVPVIGINLGRLGFLVDVSPQDLEARLDDIFAGRCVEESRSLIHVSVIRDERVVAESDALNDVVIHKADVARMIELETHIDGRLLNTQRADGLIVSTPTGSTAYALSGGGPIVHPSLQTMILVPICPHTLSSRPIAVSNQASIGIMVHDSGESQAQITCDGQIKIAVAAGDYIKIEKKAEELRLIHPPDYDYFEILRAKLHWGAHH